MELTTLKNEVNKIWGNVIYNIVYDNIIEANGPKMYIVLNGLWTNNTAQKKVMNEIARKKSVAISTDVITGEYNCSYIETDVNNVPVTVVCDLKITSNSNGSYEFIWLSSNGTPIHAGVGFKIGQQLVATYWEV